MNTDLEKMLEKYIRVQLHIRGTGLVFSGFCASRCSLSRPGLTCNLPETVRFRLRGSSLVCKGFLLYGEVY